MTNIELAQQQGNQAAPNVIDAAKASEVQIDTTLAQEQGNQATSLIADSLAGSESYDAIKQQGTQAMPLIVDVLAGGGNDTSAEIYATVDPNSDSTAFEISVYTNNASNPQYKINDGVWTLYDANNKSEIYLPGNYTIYLKAENDYDSSEIFNTTQLQIVADFDAPESHIVEDPSAMFAGLDFRVHLQSYYDNYDSDLIGRDDVVLLYKEQSAATWESVTMTGTSDGYFAEVETGWGHVAIEYKVQINGISSDVAKYYEFDALPMTPSFVDITNDQSTYKARLRFGANYPGMNTVETIEYCFIDDNENWTDAMHDVTSGYELADVTRHNAGTIYFRTKLVSDSSVTSETVTMHIQLQLPSENNN